MDMESCSSQMGQFMKDYLQMGNLMEPEDTFKQMGIIMMVNGKMEKFQDMED